MTKKETINYFKRSYTSGNTDDMRQHNEAINMAIESLEQEPILDKIKAKIEQLQNTCTENNLKSTLYYSAFGMVLDIIDECKTDKENN